ncbi:MAG: M24 family metallopeptidase [Chloroflexota bacterium]
MFEYTKRLETIRARMAEQNVGLMFLTPGANLFYLTGIPHRDHYRTDHNAYGDWAVGGYIGLRQGVAMTAPRMGGEYFLAQAADKPWFEPVRIIDESEAPLDVMGEVLKRFDLKGRRVAVEDHAWAESVMGLGRLLPAAEFVMASRLIAPMRMIKEEAELDLMRQSGQICDAAFQKALARLKPGVTAWEVECEIDYHLRQMGSDFNSFPTNVIFTNPEKDPSLALRKTERRLQPGDAVTFDFGCIYQGYASDFGRTAFAGEPSKEYRRMHELVLNAQRAAMEVMVAGQVTGAQANAAARKVMEEGGYGPEFSHRLGHGIGVTVHEPPWLDVVEDTVLQANMTFTVEPSIRIADGYHNRVEDVVQVTGKGGVSLYQTSHELAIVG